VAAAARLSLGDSYFPRTLCHNRDTTFPEAGLAAEGFAMGAGFVAFCGGCDPPASPASCRLPSAAGFEAGSDEAAAVGGFAPTLPDAGTATDGPSPWPFAASAPPAGGDFPFAGTGGASTVRYCTISEILRFEGSSGSVGTRSF
jgi:hypothetical protein